MKVYGILEKGNLVLTTLDKDFVESEFYNYPSKLEVISAEMDVSNPDLELPYYVEPHMNERVYIFHGRPVVWTDACFCDVFPDIPYYFWGYTIKGVDDPQTFANYRDSEGRNSWTDAILELQQQQIAVLKAAGREDLIPVQRSTMFLSHCPVVPSAGGG